MADGYFFVAGCYVFLCGDSMNFSTYQRAVSYTHLYEDGYMAQKPEGRLYVDGFDSEAAARYHLEGLTDCKIMN